MNINERLMRAASFTVPMTPQCPESVLVELRRALGWTGDPKAWAPADGHIVVTRAWVPVGRVSLSSALLTGRLVNLRGRSATVKGLASWLGAEGAPANIRTSKLTRSAQNLGAWLDDLLPWTRSRKAR